MRSANFLFLLQNENRKKVEKCALNHVRRMGGHDGENGRTRALFIPALTFSTCVSHFHSR